MTGTPAPVGNQSIYIFPILHLWTIIPLPRIMYSTSFLPVFVVPEHTVIHFHSLCCPDPFPEQGPVCIGNEDIYLEGIVDRIVDLQQSCAILAIALKSVKAEVWIAIPYQSLRVSHLRLVVITVKRRLGLVSPDNNILALTGELFNIGDKTKADHS